LGLISTAVSGESLAMTETVGYSACPGMCHTVSFQPRAYEPRVSNVYNPARILAYSHVVRFSSSITGYANQLEIKYHTKKF
jgi:hypothetical protein